MAYVCFSPLAPRCAALLCASLVLACRAGSFACGDDDDCASGTPGGVCEPSGFCSFPDDACPFGRRYGDLAGDDLAGECVVPEGGTDTGATSTASSNGTTITSLDGTGPLESEAESTAVASSLDGGSSGGADCPEGWWDCAWNHRLELTPQADGIALASVPVLVALTPQRVAFGDPLAVRASFRFVDAVGTVLPHEIEAIDASGGVSAWVELPLLAANTGSFWLYWDNPSASDVEDAAAVWQNGYVAVWHMVDGTDSLGGADMIPNSVSSVPGVIAGAQLFDGNDSFMQIDAGVELPAIAQTPLSVEALARPDTFGDGGRGRIVDSAIDQYGHGGWSLHLHNQSLEQANLEWSMDRTVQTETLFAPNALTTGQWRYVAATHTGDTLALYVDGVPQRVLTSQPGSGVPDLDGGEPLTIGRIAGEDRRAFEGVIDEVRISAVVRSAEWIAVQNGAMNDVLLQYGTQEQLR